RWPRDWSSDVCSSDLLDPFEAAIRRAIKNRVARGHLQLNIAWSQVSGPADGSSLNRPLLEAYVAAFHFAARQFQLPGTPDLNVEIGRASCRESGKIYV